MFESRRTGSNAIAMSRRLICAACALAFAATIAPHARADDAALVARAREQVESGAYADALKTLAGLPTKDVPPALAVEAGLLETTAALVSKGEGAGQSACAKAVQASGFDPDGARDQSPKVRAACRAAGEKARAGRVASAGVTMSALRVDAPEVAWQPVRVAATASSMPS